MRGAVGLAVVVLLAGCAGAAESPVERSAPTSDEDVPEAFVVESAGWRPGFAFTFRNTLEGKLRVQTYHEGSLVADERETVREPDAEMRLEVLSAALRFGDEPLYLVALQHDDVLDPGTLPTALLGGRTLVGARQSDLQPLLTSIHYPACTTTCRPDAIDFVDAPDHYPYLRFPLRVGDTWSGVVPTELGELAIASSVARGDASGVEVLHAVHAITVDDADVREFLEENGAEDIVITTDIRGNRTITFDPARHAPSDDLFELHVEQDVTFTVDGSRLRMLLTVDLDLRSALVAATLEEREEPGLEGVLDGLVLPGPPQPAQLLVIAEELDLNAAESPVGAFAVLGPPMRSGQELAVALDGPAGTVPLEAAAGIYTHTFTEPGAYTVVATLTEAGRVVAQGELAMPVRYEADLAIACPMPTVAGLSSCPALPLPVRAGVSSLQADCTAAAPGGLLLAKLQAADADGQAASADFSQGEASLAIGDMAPYAVDQRNWTLAYVPTVALGDTVECHVLLAVAAAPAADATVESVARVSLLERVRAVQG